MFRFFKKKYSTNWVEESFSFDQPVGKQLATPQSKFFVGSSFSMKKAIIVGAVFLCGCFLLLSRVFTIQIVSGSAYRKDAEQNRERVLPIPSERGLVYDRNGIQLTTNIPNFALALVPQDLPRQQAEREEVIQKLSKITNQTPEDIREIIEQYKSYRFESIVIEDDIDYETALRIIVEAADLPGISIQRGSKRLYAPTSSVAIAYKPEEAGPAFAHLLGYVGKLSPSELETYYAKGYLPSDTIGKTGVERTYEADMRGTFGKKRVEVNAFGQEQSVLSEDPPVPGEHLILSIDANMQLALYDILQRTLTAANKTRASAIVLDPRNGEVLAMVNIPSFDNNDFSGGIDTATYKGYIENPDQPLFPRAWAGTYPSGSTLKPAIAAAALNEKVITETTSFLSNGGLRVGVWFFPDWQAGGHGITNVRKSLAWSVNTFYYYIGGGYNNFVGLGVEKIAEYLRTFGFGSKIGIDLPGEADGFIPSKQWKLDTKHEPWYIGDTYNVSIGQGDILVTPLQIANMTATIANGGTEYRPHVVKALENAVTKEEREFAPEIVATGAAAPEYLSIIRLGMRDCVIFGSCRRLATLPVNVAGKTGTAQWNSNKANHAWFTSFAPYDHPQIVLTVLVEEGGEGSAIAAPIANDFYRWWWSYTHP